MQIFLGGFEIFIAYYKKKGNKIKWNNELNISQVISPTEDTKKSPEKGDF